MSLTFAFSGAFSAMSFRERHPKFAGCCRWLALCSTATAAGVLTLSLLLPSNTFTLSPWELHRADIILICAAAGGDCSGDKRQHGETPADHREEAELRREIIRDQHMAVTPTALATKVKRAAAGDSVSGFTNISPVVIGTASKITALPSS
nr:COPII coat assembly protein [Ipomoea batatas]